jgi:hypothetical protein
LFGYSLFGYRTLVSLLMSMFFILIMKLVLHFVCMHKSV